LWRPGWIHAYEHPLVAVLMNPIHADFKSPRLWEAEGEIAIRDGLKCGCATLTTVREIPLPAVTTEMRVRFGILCAKEVCTCFSWNAWADRWLSGEDRSEAATGAAAEAAQAASAWAAAAAEAAAGAGKAAAWAAQAAEAAAAWAAQAAEAAEAQAAEAAEAAAWAAQTAAWSAEAARDVGHRKDFFAIAEKACAV
jgi:hypothetical protein